MLLFASTDPNNKFVKEKNKKGFALIFSNIFAALKQIRR
jgi:hypothetical protein